MCFLLCAGPATSASLSIAADQASYLVGDTITLTVIGDAEGAADFNFFVDVEFRSIVEWESTVQGVATTGGIPWFPAGTVAACNFGLTPGRCPALDQVFGLTPAVPDAPVLSTLTFTALAPGIATFDTPFGSGSGNPDPQVFFFGLQDGPETSVRIGEAGPSVPEPNAALLFGIALGVGGLASRKHTR